MMRVWIDQDLCTGDGVCTDHCPDVFTMLEDGISYVHHPGAPPEGGGLASAIVVASRHEVAVVAAALECPGECIFLEHDPEHVSDREFDDVIEAEIVSDHTRDPT